MDRARELRGRVGQQRDLVGAERDREVGADGRPGKLSGVDVDTARYVDGDDRDTAERRERSRGLGLESRPPADPDDAVDDEVRHVPWRLAGHAPAGPGEGDQPGLVGLVRQQPGAHPAATPREQRAGVQGVAPVVAAAYQQHDLGAVRASQEVEHGARQTRRCPLHQRAVRQPRHQRRLRRPHLLDRVRAPHAATLASPSLVEEGRQGPSRDPGAGDRTGIGVSRRSLRDLLRRAVRQAAYFG